MSKLIEGVVVEASMVRRRKTRGELAAERKKRIEERAKKAREIIEDRESLDSAKNHLIQRHNNGVLVNNSMRNGIALGRQYADLKLNPKKRLRYFLQEELSMKPDYNGRYAVMAGFSKDKPTGTFITAFTNRHAANTAMMLAYKEGTYRNINVCDRGPGYNFQTTYIKRA